MPRVVGILALQGGFQAHATIVRSLGAEPREIRRPADLEGLDALIIPGGESTVMSLGVEREGLAEPIRHLISAGTPVLGTCAAMIIRDRAHPRVLDRRTRPALAIRAELALERVPSKVGRAAWAERRMLVDRRVGAIATGRVGVLAA